VIAMTLSWFLKVITAAGNSFRGSAAENTAHIEANYNERKPCISCYFCCIIQSD